MTELERLVAVLGAITGTQDIESSLGDVLARCVDAGAASMGAAYLVKDGLELELRASVGLDPHANQAGFFGQANLLRRVLASGETLVVRSGDTTDAECTALLAAMGARSCLITPLCLGEERLGTLVLASSGEIGVAFAKAVGSQLSQALLLRLAVARMRNEKEVMERLKSAEAQLHQSQKMEAIGRLAGGIAHDFNNLLTVILSYSRFAFESLEESHAARADIEEVRKAAERAAMLTRQLLIFGRREVVTPEVLDLNGVVSNLEKLLQRTLGEDVLLSTVRAEELSPILADPGKIEQALANLAVNARDAMPRGGKLTISTANAGSFVRLRVVDTGEGIEPGILNRIFEPFFTTKPKGKGTGLGLSTVYGIVQQAGGYVSVESEVGTGATFDLFFPVSHESAEEYSRKPPSSELEGKGETILVVEDEVAVLLMTERILRAHGYSVIGAAGGPPALGHIRNRSTKIDMMLTDIVMPGMSGKVLADSLVKERPGIPVLFMSGYTEDEISNHGVLQRGAELLAKPFTHEDLLRRVRTVLSSRSVRS